MPASETLEIIIRMRDEARRNLEKLNTQLKGTETRVARTRRALRGFGQGLSRLRASVLNFRTGLIAAGAAMSALFLGRRLIQAADQQAKAVEGLDAALRSMGRFTPELSANLQDVAKGLQEVTNFGDEATIEGTKFLVTYKDITDDLLPRSQKAMADLAALMGGDTVQAANLLGRASLGLTGSLRRAGISVDQATFKAEGYAGVLTQIETQVKGQAEAQRRATGSLVGLGNAWGDVQEKAGEFIKTAIEPTVRAIADEVNRLNNYLKRLKDEGTLDEWAKEASAAIIDFVEVVVKSVAVLIDSFRGLKLIYLGLKAAFGLLTEFTLRGLAAIADVVDDLRQKFRDWQVDAIKIGKILQFAPDATLRGLGKYLVALEEGNVELGKTGKELRKQAGYWQDVTNQTSDQIVELASQESYYSRADTFINNLRKRALEYTKQIGQAAEETKKLTPDPTVAEDIPLAARLKSALTRATALINTELAQVDAAYEQNLISLQQYYDERQRLAEANFRNEIAHLEQLAQTERDPAKRLAINDQIFSAEQKFQQDMIQLAEDRRKAEDALEAGRAAIGQAQRDQQLDLARQRGEGLATIFALEDEQLRARQEQEIEDLVAQNATKAQIEEQYRLQQLERDQQFADQRKQINQLVMEGIMMSLDSMSQAFGDAYAASGQKAKEFFYAQKAIAIVQTGIKTYEAAQAAYSAMAGIPYVGPILGAIAAAAAIAAGLARIAAIRNQNLAEGGPVKGYSPTSKADNIPAMLTAEEFVQPVAAVKYYGKGAMEAIRRRIIPREVLSGFNFPSIPTPAYAFQTGGAVAAQASRGSAGRGPKPPTTAEGAGAGAEQTPININNIIDPQMMDQYVASKPGQRNILNVMSQNQFALKQIVLGEG